MNFPQEQIDRIKTEIFPEMDRFLVVSAKRLGDDAMQEDPKYCDAHSFREYIEGLYGTNIWDQILALIATDEWSFEKYFDCIPAEKVFNSKGLNESDESSYSHLHPAFEKQLLRVVNEAINEELRVFGLKYEPINPNAYVSQQSGERPMHDAGEIASLGVGNIHHRHDHISGEVEINDNKRNLAALYSFFGYVDVAHSGRPVRLSRTYHGNVGFYLTLQQPDNSNLSQITSHHGGVTCKIINEQLHGAVDNTHILSYYASLLSNESAYGHVRTARDLLKCANNAVRMAVRQVWVE